MQPKTFSSIAFIMRRRGHTRRAVGEIQEAYQQILSPKSSLFLLLL